MEQPGLVRSTLGYLRDPQVALWRKLSGLGAALYVVWPLDLIPDWIPILGWLDDLGVVGFVAWFLVRDIRRHAGSVEQVSDAQHRQNDR